MRLIPFISARMPCMGCRPNSLKLAWTPGQLAECLDLHSWQKQDLRSLGRVRSHPGHQELKGAGTNQWCARHGCVMRCFHSACRIGMLLH